MPGKRSAAKPYIGDQILAGYQGLSSCCCLGLFSFVGAALLGVAAKPSIVEKAQKDYPSDAWKYLSDPKNTALIGGLLIALVIVDVFWIVGTWRGRRWALWLHLVLGAPGAIAGLMFSDGRIGSILPGVVVIYCILRLAGHVGPNKSKRKSRS